MTNNQQIAAIERDVRAARYAREQYNALERLKKNTDFINLVEQAYFRDEAIRLVHLRGEPGADRESIDEQMNAIAGLSSFFREIRQKADQAEKSIRDGESLIEQLHNEGD